MNELMKKLERQFAAVAFAEAGDVEGALELLGETPPPQLARKEQDQAVQQRPQSGLGRPAVVKA